jgi:hypothetical protein
MYSNGKTLDISEKFSCIFHFLQLIFSILVHFCTIISQNNFLKNNIFHEDFFCKLQLSQILQKR